jgi:signal transduction histidine kinase
MESGYRYRTLYVIAKKLTSSLAPEEVLNTIVESTAKAMGAKGCSLLLLTPDKKQLIHTISYGLSESYLRKGPVRSDAVISEVLKGNPVAIQDAAQDPRVQYKEQAIREGIASMLSVPLMPEGEIMGVMRIYTSGQRQFSLEDIEFLSSVANLGAIALGKARMHEALGRDLEERSIEVSRLEEDKARFLRFLSIAAHDLKAPLTAIQGFLWVMLGGFSGELTDKQRHMLQRSSRRINELLNLISDLLDIPRIESGQTVQEIKEVSLCEVVRCSCDDLRGQAKEKGVKLKVELPQGLLKIPGSSPRLQQVMTNLVSNAINYTPEGVITVRVKEEDNDIKVEVMDTGIGIPPEDLSRVFDDFFRASNVEIRGTGLGLSITRRIVEAHGGNICVESPCPESNTGSKFTFTLPKKSETERRQQ